MHATMRALIEGGAKGRGRSGVTGRQPSDIFIRIRLKDAFFALLWSSRKRSMKKSVRLVSDAMSMRRMP